MNNTFWTPNSCDCTIEYGEDGTYINSITRCKLPAHQNAIDAAHLVTVLTHHRPFQLIHGNNPTKAQREEIAKNCHDEKIRIRNL